MRRRNASRSRVLDGIAADNTDCHCQLRTLSADTSRIRILSLKATTSDKARFCNLEGIFLALQFYYHRTVTREANIAEEFKISRRERETFFSPCNCV